jgi:hypothetical protein
MQKDSKGILGTSLCLIQHDEISRFHQHKFPKLTQEEIDTLNSPVSIKVIDIVETIVKNPYYKEKWGLGEQFA